MLFRHSDLMSFSTRSSFHEHLQSIYLCHVVISETDLLQYLSSLPLLQRLGIADHQIVDRGNRQKDAKEHLITNTLLSSLTRSRTLGCPSLLPDLRFLSCWSLLEFDDSLYLDFVLSRLQNEALFEAELQWVPDCHRELDSAVVGRLPGLCA